MTEELNLIGVKGGRLLTIGCGEVLEKLKLGVPVEGGRLLDVAEVAYIIFTGACRVVDGNSELGLDKLFIEYGRSKYDWIRFAVILDLRERGRKARVGFGENDVIYYKGSEKYQVFVVEENAPIPAESLAEWTRMAVMKGYEPIVAVVDAHGDVTYYSTRVLKISDLKEVVGNA